MKTFLKLCTFFFFTLNYQILVSQVVTTKEEFPNGEKDITFIFNLKLAKDNRAGGLLGKTSDVFLWSGAGVEETGDAFRFAPTGQTNFNAPFEPGKMTSLGNDRWSITLNPRTFYKVPADFKIIKKLGLVVKNGAGNAQTEDFILTLYDNGLNIKIIEPTANLVLNDGLNFNIRAKFSEKVTEAVFSLSYFNQQGTLVTKGFTNITNADSISRKIITENITFRDEIVQIQSLNINATETTKGLSKTEKVNMILKPKVTLEAVPAGIKDGVNVLPNGKVIFCFYAPQKLFTHFLSDASGWQATDKNIMKKDPAIDRFWIEWAGYETGKEYAYQFLVDGSIQVADPFAEKILDPKFDGSIPNTININPLPYPTNGKGIVSVLSLLPKYEFKIKNFERPKAENLMVYELLIRDFTTEGTYKAAMERIPYLKNLGINAIELMPVMEFTANDSWGYNPTFYLAADKAYGTNNELKQFVDKCHENGIAVILDMVLNQADETCPYVPMYFENGNISPTSPFFNISATHPFSVFRDFNHESTATKRLVDRVNTFWLEEYKMDGFRFDLSKGFTQTKNTDVGLWGNYDASRVAIWKRIYDQIRKTDASAYVILEHFAANNEEQELADYGMMFWANANGNYRNAIKAGGDNINGLSHKVRAFSKPNLLGYMESHDEERMLFDLQKNGISYNGYDTKSLPNALNRAKTTASLFFLTEGPKLIWQFGELGYDISIDQNGRTGKKPVLWEYYDNAERRKLHDTYQELIKLKKIIETEKPTFTYKTSGRQRKIKIESGDKIYWVLTNLDVEPQIIEHELAPGTWYDYFTNQSFAVNAGNTLIELQPGEFHVYSNKTMAITKAGLNPWSSFKEGKILAEEVSSKLDKTRIIIENPSFINDFKFHVSLDQNQNYTWTIYNANGQMVYNGLGKGSKTIDLGINELQMGVYFLKVNYNGTILNKKIVNL